MTDAHRAVVRDSRLWRLRAYELERRFLHGNEGDPEQPPRRQPGDIYILVGTIVGTIAGGALAYVCSGLSLIIGLGIIGGGIAGAIIGSWIKKWRVAKRRAKNRTHP